MGKESYSAKKVLSLMGENISGEVLFKIKDVSLDILIKVVKNKERECVGIQGRLEEKKDELKSEIEQLKL